MSIYDGNFDPFLGWNLFVCDLKRLYTKIKRRCQKFRMDRTYYEILGVSENASLEEIKKAYKIRFFHPDVFKGSPETAHVKTAELNEAYEILSNHETRVNYDAWLKKQRDAQRQKNTSSEQRKSEKQNMESDKKGTNPNVSNVQTGVRPKTVAVIVLALIAVFYFIFSTTTERQAKEIEELRTQLEETLEENESKEQYEVDLRSEIESISNELNFQENRGDEYYECAVLTAFYRQTFDHYSILSNVFSMAASSPDYYRKSRANVNFNTRLLTLTMENTANLFDEYCDGLGFEAQDDLDNIMDDLRRKNDDALTCVLSLGNGEAVGSSLDLMDESEDCRNKMNDLNSEYWNVFHELIW